MASVFIFNRGSDSSHWWELDITIWHVRFISRKEKEGVSEYGLLDQLSLIEKHISHIGSCLPCASEEIPFPYPSLSQSLNLTGSETGPNVHWLVISLILDLITSITSQHVSIWVEKAQLHDVPLMLFWSHCRMSHGYPYWGDFQFWGERFRIRDTVVAECPGVWVPMLLSLHCAFLLSYRKICSYSITSF